MPEDNENTHYDENTLRKVYEALMKAGVFGQKAVDAVNQMQNAGILFRERKPKRRGRPPKSAEQRKKEAEAKDQEKSTESVEDAWKPKEDVANA